MLNSLKKISQLELRRKLLHILIGIIGFLLILKNILTPLSLFTILIIGGIISLISLKFKIPLIKTFLKNFERPDEKIPGRAVLSAVAGTLLVLQLFPRQIALASIIILIFADPISHLIGKTIGKTKSILNNNKNIEGNILGAIISSGFAMFFVSPTLAFAGSLIAMIFELVIIKIQDIQVDDNLIIPLVAGTTMHLIQIFLII